MSRISFRVVSIELKEISLQKINKNNLVRLNLTQKPSRIAEEYIVNNFNELRNINHEFTIDDPFNKVEKLSMTIRSVLKKTTLSSIFNLDKKTNKEKQPIDHSVDQFIGNHRENRQNNTICKYVDPKYSLIGTCIINMKEIKRGVNNSFQAEIHSRICDQVIGYVNLQIYTWNIPPSTILLQNNTQENEQHILFIDPGCPVVNASLL